MGLDEVREVIHSGLEAFHERVALRGRPDVTVKLRKKFDLAGLRFTCGTDIALMDREGEGNPYKPNFQWDLRDRLFNGKVRVETRSKQITYSKSFGVEKMKVQVNGGVNYISGQTYLGFNVKTGQGVSSSVNSNGISFNQRFDTLLDHPKVKFNVSGVIELPEATYNANSNVMEVGPVEVQPEEITATVTF